MQLPYNTLLVAALGLDCALAQPAHRHKHRRALADVDWNDKANYGGVNWSTVKYGNGVAASTPTATSTTAVVPTTTAVVPTTTADVATTTTAASQPAKGTPLHDHNVQSQSSTSQAPVPSGDSSTSGSKSFGGRTDPKDNGNKDEYIGNVGVPYGSNMIMLDSVDDAKKFKYSNTFTNPTSENIQVIVWNKSGKDGRPQSGMGLAPLQTFSLGPKESKAMAFDENSQVAFAQDCVRDPMKGNLPNCTWGEVDFGDLQNGGWSGYDRSSIPNGAGNTGLLTISCEGAKTSSKEENSFTDVAQTNAGGALAPGPAHFFTTMGA